MQGKWMLGKIYTKEEKWILKWMGESWKADRIQENRVTSLAENNSANLPLVEFDGTN